MAMETATATIREIKRRPDWQQRADVFEANLPGAQAEDPVL